MSIIETPLRLLITAHCGPARWVVWKGLGTQSPHSYPIAFIKERLASPRSWFTVLVYVAAKLVRIATALLKYTERRSASRKLADPSWY